MVPAGRPLVRTFADSQQALAAIRALEAAQVDRESISVVARSPEQAEHIEADTGTSDDLEDETEHRHPLADFIDWLGRVGSVTVPGFGAILGTGNLWQDVTMAGTGRGSITGALVGLGVPVDEASSLEQAVANGQILVVVHNADANTIPTALSTL